MFDADELVQADVAGVLRECQKIWTKLRTRVKAVDARHLNKQVLLDEVSQHVHGYLQDDRAIIQFRLGADSTTQLDAVMRALLGFTRTRTEKARYVDALGKTIKLFGQLETSALDRRFDPSPISTDAALASQSATASVVTETSTKVFVVHGHNDSLKEGVARFLEQLDLQPIILHEQVNRGKTIIEKVEAFSDVSFAVVLLTDDDVGSVKANVRNLQSRARQNVIFEWGYLIARLGRPNVCALRSSGVELPSDLQGVVYTDVDVKAAWKTELARELHAAGLPIDLNRLLK